MALIIYSIMVWETRKHTNTQYIGRWVERGDRGERGERDKRRERIRLKAEITMKIVRNNVLNYNTSTIKCTTFLSHSNGPQNGKMSQNI